MSRINFNLPEFLEYSIPAENTKIGCKKIDINQENIRNGQKRHIAKKNFYSYILSN